MHEKVIKGFNMTCWLACALLNVYNVYVCTCLVSQMIASKYLNDEGEAESVLNSEWAKIGKSVIKTITYILVGSFQAYK